MKNCEKYPLVSVYTCVYNGEKTISRVFESMKKLTYPNIEHVIVNDGSTDATEDMIKEYSAQVSFPIKYFKKENGGKHTALNVAWANASGEFMIQLDADDELFPHCVTFLVDTYYKIPEEERDQYWCVHGRCVTQHGDFVGKPYPDNVNEGGWRAAAERATKCDGEKIGLQVTKYLSQYRFPEIKGTHFLPEMIVWKQINAKYGTWYTNEVVRVYYVNEGGNLSATRTKRSQYGSLAYFYKWSVTHPQYFPSSVKVLCRYSLTFFISSKEYRKNNKYLEEFSSFKHKCLLVLMSPATFVGSILFRWRKGVK